MTVSKRTRFEVLRRDAFTCRYCGAEAPGVLLDIDHVIPKHHGGTDDRWNLTAACTSCNAGKSSGVAIDEVICDVRRDETYYQQSHARNVVSCEICARPVTWLVGDEDVPTKCAVCDTAAVEAYWAGVAYGLQRVSA